MSARTERRPGRPRRDADPSQALVRRRANRELTLLLLAVVVTLLAYGLVGLAQGPELPPDLAAYGGAMLALALTAHLVRRRRAPGADPVLLPVAVLLNGLGLVMVRRLDFAFEATGTESMLAPAQTMWTVVAVAVFCATLLILGHHDVLDRYRYVIGLLSLMVLLLPLLPVLGQEINGARLWVRLGPMTFQPAEIAKLGLVVFFASYLAEKRQVLAVATSRIGPVMVPPARAFAPVLVAWLLSLAILVFQRDLGLSLLFFGVFAIVLYMATQRVAYAALAGVLFAGGASFAFLLFDHVATRITTWLDPWSVIDDAGFQLGQSLFALATGGITGVGWGQGRPDFIPFVETDFIFAAFGEELGLLGTTALMLLYFLLVARGFTVALRARDDFGMLLAAGLTVIFAIQVFVIIGGVTRLVPLTGLTLPFVSYGGSSLVANYILIALLLRVSSSSQDPPVAAGRGQAAEVQG